MILKRARGLIVTDVILFSIYVICFCYLPRPFYRVLSFACISVGLMLCFPQLWLKMLDPTYLPSSNLPMHLLFMVGDVISHVGLVMQVYWDICMEAVQLVYALEPKRQQLGIRICNRVGTVSVVGQVMFLVPFWLCQHYLQSESSGAVLSATFYVVLLVV